MARPDELRIDDLAQQAGIATTTVRLYQQRGLLAPPRLEGRTGWYDGSHLARLRLISRLQAEGHSLSGIGRLLASWQEGRDLTDLVGVEQQFDALLHGGRSVVLDPPALLARFPDGAVSMELVQGAIDLGLVEPIDDGRFRVPDERFLTIGSELAHLGVPPATVLDEWRHLLALTDQVAERFVALFETNLLPAGGVTDLSPEAARALGGNLARLHHLAGQVLATAFDASLARLAGERLRALVPDPIDTASPP